MRLVIADTSPINYVLLIGRIDVLRGVFLALYPKDSEGKPLLDRMLLAAPA